MKKNILVSTIGQIVVIVLGIFLPRIMIVNYGSDTNGLISTVAQIFTYMALLEAGIGQAARNALYGPLSRDDRDGVSRVASTATGYYRRVTILYGIGVLSLALLVPQFLKSEINKIEIFFVILLEGMSGVISFYFIQTPSTILLADGKAYVNNEILYVNKILSSIVKIVMASMHYSIVFLQLAYFIITIAKVFVYRSYFKKHYPWVDFHLPTKKAILADRNSYIITEIAWTIFSSTDMIVLSFFLSTKVTSVYTIYNLVFSNLNVLLTTVYNSITYMLGLSFYKGIKKYSEVHDAFNSIFMGSITALMIVALFMIFPFIRLYTRDVMDINYIHPKLPLLFCLVQLLSWSRYVSGNLTGIAGYAKKVTVVSLIEAIANVTFSVMLVLRFGIEGVLFATVIALPLKVIYCNYVADKLVMRRPALKTVRILGINFLLFAVAVILNRYISVEANSYAEFFVKGGVIAIVVLAVSLSVNAAVNPSALKTTLVIFGKKK